MRRQDFISILRISDMKYYLILIGTLMGQLNAQDTFWDVKNFSDSGSEEPYHMEIRNDTVFVWGRGTCDEEECMQYYQYGKDGKLIMHKEYPGIRADWRVELHGSHFYLPISYHSDWYGGIDGFRLGKFNLQGDLLTTAKYDLDDLENAPDFDADFYYSYGCIRYDERIVVYGVLIDEVGDTEKWQTCMFWYDETDLSLDTIILTTPFENTFRPWDALIDNDGLLTLLVEHRIEPSAGQRDCFLVYAKYDATGNNVAQWDGPEDSGRYLHSRMALAQDNSLVMSGSFVSEAPYWTDDKLLRRVSPDGEILWETRIGTTYATDFFSYLDIDVGSDGHVLGVGRVSSAIGELTAAYIFKIDINTGKFIWERFYQDWNSRHIFLDNIEEFSDGSLFVTGSYRYNLEEDGVIIMRVDEDGCLEPGCGGHKHHLAGEPVYDYLISNQSMWYFQQPDADGHIARHTFFHYSISGDTTLWHDWTDVNLAPEEPLQDVNMLPGLYLLREAGKKIYYNLDGQSSLIYDFTLDVGDEFVTDYTEHPLVVIESDTITLSNRSKMRYWTLACTENSENTITWYEKMGTYHGILWPRDFCSGDYGDQKLTCFYRFERFAHMNPEYDDCLTPLTSTEDPGAYHSLAAITAHPNPTTAHITLTAPPELHIQCTELLDTRGVTHTAFHDKSSEVTLDLSGYPSGLYFVSVHTEEGSVVKKVVVE